VLTVGADAVAWTQAVLMGMGQPWVIAVVLALTTLLLEDLAIAAGVALATQGVISWELSFVAVAGGIAAGDLACTRLAWRRDVSPGCGAAMSASVRPGPTPSSCNGCRVRC
jgi:hypothetical protein